MKIEVQDHGDGFTVGVEIPETGDTMGRFHEGKCFHNSKENAARCKTCNDWAENKIAELKAEQIKPALSGTNEEIDEPDPDKFIQDWDINEFTTRQMMNVINDRHDVVRSHECVIADLQTEIEELEDRNRHLENVNAETKKVIEFRGVEIEKWKLNFANHDVTIFELRDDLKQTEDFLKSWQDISIDQKLEIKLLKDNADSNLSNLELGDTIDDRDEEINNLKQTIKHMAEIEQLMTADVKRYQGVIDVMLAVKRG